MIRAASVIFFSRPAHLQVLSPSTPTTRLLLAPTSIKLVSGSFSVFCGPWENSYCFVKMPPSTFSCTVFLYNVLALEYSVFCMYCRGKGTSDIALVRKRGYQVACLKHIERREPCVNFIDKQVATILEISNILM
jgi:hypothetical protein